MVLRDIDKAMDVLSFLREAWFEQAFFMIVRRRPFIFDIQGLVIYFVSWNQLISALLYLPRSYTIFPLTQQLAWKTGVGLEVDFWIFVG